MADDSRSPLLDHDPSEEPVFLPENLIEGARRQKGLARGAVPGGCHLDFDGELLDYLARSGAAIEDPSWPRFHTRLFRMVNERCFREGIDNVRAQVRDFVEPRTGDTRKGDGMKRLLVLAIVLAALSASNGCMILMHPDHTGHHTGEGRGTDGEGSGKGGHSH